MNNYLQKIKVIIVDDEQYGCEILTSMLAKYQDVEVLQTFNYALDALEYLIDNTVDLVFLDIQMTPLDGFDFVKRLKAYPNIPSIIFVTGFEEYAMRAIKTVAFDYMLKPVDEKELDDSISRYRLSRHKNNGKEKILKLMTTVVGMPKIQFRAKKGLTLIAPNDILFVESLKNSCRIHLCNNQTETVSLPMSEVNRMLNESSFSRISNHKIVNLKYLYKLDKCKCCCSLKMKNKIYEFDISKNKICQFTTDYILACN